MSDEYVSPDDLKVRRNADGEALPVEEHSDMFGKLKVIPMAYGDVQEFFGDGDTADLETPDIAELFDRFIAKPDLSADAGGQVTEEYVNDMYPLAPRELLMAILRASGVEADVDMDEENMEAEVTVQGN